MKTPPDPLRVQLLEITEQLTQRVATLRDFANVPGNAWLAKNELQQITGLISDLETLLGDIKQADAEIGY
jgi:hypothetical protein